MRRLLALLLALIATVSVGLAVACSDRDDDSDSPTPGDTSTPAGPTSTRPASTPQALPAELQAIMDNLASVRGLEAPPELEVNLVARSALRGLLDSLLTDEDREWFRNTTTLYRLLGHFRDDQDY